MKRALLALFLIALSAVHAAPTHAAKKKSKTSQEQHARRTAAARILRDGEAEARLIDIYKLVGQGQGREALFKAERLVKDQPNFQLAQLVYGDLLAAQSRPVRTLGDVPDTTAKAAPALLADLRAEALLRLNALRQRPPVNTVPSQFLALSPRNKHAIAVDTSKSRLYLFENNESGTRLIADYYISVGKSGTEKSTEGDLRTPLGVYFITSTINPKSLPEFYGVGALPINYPNQLDIKRGKTGSGIWLHGPPPNQFSRPPLATDGCVALANSDLQRIIKTVEVGTTPVVIAQTLKWVAPQSVQADKKIFENALLTWMKAKSSRDLTRLVSLYSPEFSSNGKTLTEWKDFLRTEVEKSKVRPLALKDVSYLRWTDKADTMIVTFGEVAAGAKNTRTVRQYWAREKDNQWKIFFEGAIG